MLDWNAMCLIETRLLDVESLAIRLGTDSRYEGYSLVKDQLQRLVGWGAEKDELRSEEAWGVALEHTAMRCAP